jgi:hypothetical protein
MEGVLWISNQPLQGVDTFSKFSVIQSQIRMHTRPRAVTQTCIYTTGTSTNIPARSLPYTTYISFFLFFFSQSRTFLPNHSSCRGLLFMWPDTVTHSHLVRLPVLVTCPSQRPLRAPTHNSDKRQTPMLLVEFPILQCLQASALRPRGRWDLHLYFLQ